ncbi:MAG: hypothetical protein H7175_13265 [Burkholderiales bacterium]|nr:hypothetical protein [Anaerolineae bacterium]
MTTNDSEPTANRKRPRKTKAERDAELAAQAAAEAAKPIDPIVWMILGGLLLFVALWTWLDPVTFAEAGQAKDWSVFQLVPLLLVRVFGKTPAVIIMTVLGLLPLAWGIKGWLRKRFRS